jgi:hypothetical protein
MHVFFFNKDIMQKSTKVYNSSTFVYKLLGFIFPKTNYCMILRNLNTTHILAHEIAKRPKKFLDDLHVIKV